MRRLKITVFVVALCCLFASCASVETSPSGGSTENLIINRSQTPADTAVGRNTNVAAANTVTVNQNTVPNQNAVSAIEIKSPRQTKPRRAAIRFPDDCNYQLADETGEHLLERACTNALLAAQAHLPKDECNYERLRDSSGYFNLAEYGAQFYSLSPNKYLVEITCWTAAYNVSNVYLLYDESEIPARTEVLEFPWLKTPAANYSGERLPLVTAKTVGGRWFDKKAKELIVFNVGRGIGDFGQYARYSFAENKPKLEEFRAQFEYREGSPSYGDDVSKRPPKTWKRYYPK